MRVLDLSIVIPTFNRRCALKRTIEVIVSKEILPSQIVIVDQSQDEATREANKRLKQLCNDSIDFKYVFQDKPSLTAARNKGMRLASNNIIVFMDDDVDVNEDSLQYIFELMSDENVSMLGAIDETLPTGGGMLGYFFNLKSIKNRSIGSVTASIHGRYPEKISGSTPTMWAMGFCFAIKKEDQQKWSIWFDENMTGYAYAEDLDFTFRYYKHARSEGLKCILSDCVSVKHLESREYRVPTASLTYRYIINREYIAYKNGMTIVNWLALRWSNFGQFLLRVKNRENAIDIIKAEIKCNKVRKYLKQGILHQDFYN